MDFITQKQKVGVNAGKVGKKVLFRMSIITILCFIGFSAILCRALYLHLVDNDDLKWIADKQYNANIPMSVRRGKIFDRNGAELALSLPVPSLFADPALVEDPPLVAQKLSKLLDMSEQELLSKFKNPRRFVWLKRRISYDKLKEVMALKIQGVNYIEESRRFYPNGELASQVLGAVGYDSQALAGLELAFNHLLISKKKSVQYKRDARGRVYEMPVGFAEQADVSDIYLTLDKQVQFITENALRSAVEEHNAVDGVAVVIDPKSGDVLAMASAPRFDPNRYSKFNVSDWRNRAVTDTFEPGSTFKVLVVAAGLEAGVVKTDSVFFCEHGSIRIGNDVLNDHHPYGNLTVEDIIKFSSNIGATKIAYKVGKQGLYDTLKKFGIGSITRVDFPGEVGGVLRNYAGWQPVEQATIAFGQGISATPLQLANAFTAVVNGGYYFRPRLVSRIVDNSGQAVMSQDPEVISRPISGGVSEIMRSMLGRVVEKGGTGTKAHSEEYTIGGKTGTAQKAIHGGGGYAKGKYFSSFIGFGPVEDPKLVVFVGLDEPRNGYYGGAVAAPAVKEIIEQSLRYLDVPSSKSLVIASEGKENDEAETKTGPVEKTRPRFERISETEFVMPDFTGFTIRDVLKASHEAGLDTSVEGSGVAVRQKPLPGSALGQGGKVAVKFELPE